MKANAEIGRLRELQAEVDALRKKLGLSAPGEMVYCEPLTSCDAEEVVVEADGFGGATVSVVEGNFPMDYLTHKTKKFETEDAAVRAAESISEGETEPEAVLR
ncbi:MAG TPA: hypothetical protein VMV72_15520 [Verrucomicrobiae bacterium]|nr:hypothetical protein [Verrucomicrobiae bacterium]